MFVKFNSLLKQKRYNKTRDPIVKQVADILEDSDNEFLTGVQANVEEAQEPEAESEEGQVAEQGKRKRVVRPRTRKRTRRIIDITEGDRNKPECATSSDTEDDHDANINDLTDHSSHSDSDNSISME